MTSKTETAKQLVTIATDETRPLVERIASLEQADTLRKELKVGWAKIGWTYDHVTPVGYLEDLNLWLTEEKAKIEAKYGAVDWGQSTSPKRMTPNELLKSKGATTAKDFFSHVKGHEDYAAPTDPITMADIWQEDIEEGQAAQVTELEQQVMKCFRTYDTLEGTQSDCGVSWTDAAELSKQSGLPLATVKGVLGSLVKKGWVHADDDKGKPQAQCLTPEGAVVTHELVAQAEHQSDFVPPTVVSDAPVANPEPSLPEAPVSLTTAERGAIGVMSRDLLQTDAPYEEIALAIRARYPHAKTTARSLASVAADMRRDGIPCPPRRKGGK